MITPDSSLPLDKSERPESESIPPPTATPDGSSSEQTTGNPVLAEAGDVPWAAAPEPAPPVLAPQRRTLSLEMWIALILTGVLTLLVCITVSGRGPGRDSASYRAGLVLGAITLWPIVIVGLLSIWRRFRSSHARAITLLVVWGLTILGQSANLLATRAERVREGLAKRNSFPAIDPAPEVSTEVEREPDGTKENARAIEAAAASDLDFSAGSNERFVKSITDAQQERYRRITAAYRAACEAQPDDARLALERVRFLEHYVHAEDIVIESASADFDLARQHLERNFPDAPGTVLFVLEHTFGDEFTAKVMQHAHRVAKWPDAEAARFHLLQAQRENVTRKAARVETLARKSFELTPTAEAGILLAESLLKSGRKEAAFAVLEHAVFARPESNWIRKQRMDLLFDLGRNAEALEALTELRGSAPLFVRNHDVATRLARAGRVAEGRALLAELRTSWHAGYFARQRFEFELQFGDARQAANAYHQFRDVGFGMDPLGRQRFELLRRHPLQGWSGWDAVVFGTLVLAIGLAAMLPVLLLAPIHHWSLWRERGGKAVAWSISPWGLRNLWGLLGIAGVGALLVTWYFNPHVLQSGWSGVGEFDPTAKMLPPMFVLWTLLGTTMAVMLWRARSWQLLGPGRWGVVKAVGVGLGFALALRFAVFVYIHIFPGAGSGMAQVSPVATEFLRSLHGAIGPVGLLGVIALFVPLLEEVVFRGLLLGAMTKHIPFAAANVIQAVAFAALHESLLLFPFFFGFGVLAGVFVRRAEGLLPAIVMHGCNNAIAGLAFIFVSARAAI